MNEQNCLTALIIPHLELVMEMIEKNLFRPLPVLKKAPPPTEGMTVMEEEDLLIDPSWPHLQPVYEFFLQLISKEAADVKSLKVFISHGFIQEVNNLNRYLWENYFFSSWNYSILKSQEKENIWKIFCIDCMPNSFQEEKWLEKPLQIVFILSFMRMWNSMVRLSFLIFLQALSAVLLFLWEKSTLFSSRRSSSLFIKSNLVISIMKIFWEAQCFSWAKIHLFQSL